MSQSTAHMFRRNILNRPVWTGKPRTGQAVEPRAMVTDLGLLKITGDPMSATEALSLAAWIIETFKPPLSPSLDPEGT